MHTLEKNQSPLIISGKMKTVSTIITQHRVTRSSTRQHKVSSAKAATHTIHTTSETLREEAQASSYIKTLSASRTPSIHAQRFGLIQEKVGHQLYPLLVAAILWNRTKGIQAKPIFAELMHQYPSPELLAEAQESELADLLRPLGLQNSRAKRFLAFATAWLRYPPTKQRRYRRLHYPSTGSGKDIGPTEVLDPEDPREGWEIAHLPGVGPYALDSFRIFHRDILRGLATDWEGTGLPAGLEPEWKRVIPQDKELKAYIRWMWLREGWLWDPSTGRKVRASAKRMKKEQARTSSLSPELL